MSGGRLRLDFVYEGGLPPLFPRAIRARRGSTKIDGIAARVVHANTETPSRISAKQCILHTVNPSYTKWTAYKSRLH